MRVPSTTTKQSLFESSDYPLEKQGGHNIGKLKACSVKLKGVDPKGELFSRSTIDIIESIENTAGALPHIEHLGLVTGAAIVRTKNAKSNSCATLLAGLHQQNASSSTSSNASPCTTLRESLSKLTINSDIGAPNNTAAIDPTSLAINIDASYSNSSYKTMELEDHASVLAIQWIPIDIRECKKKNKSNCTEDTQAQAE
jgi:hypothetical protein